MLFALYQQGLTEHLTIAILHQVDAVAVPADLSVATSHQLDTGTLNFAARINLSEWKNNPVSRQYSSFIKPKGGRKSTVYFQDFIGCQVSTVQAKRAPCSRRSVTMSSERIYQPTPLGRRAMT